MMLPLLLPFIQRKAVKLHLIAPAPAPAAAAAAVLQILPTPASLTLAQKTVTHDYCIDFIYFCYYDQKTFCQIY